MGNSTKDPKPKQTGKGRMGRPPNAAVYAVYVKETLALMFAIKKGSGGLSNPKIEKALGIGQDETGHYSGRYFSRYLKTSKTAKPVALGPDKLSQIAEKAAELGWLDVPKSKHGNMFKLKDPFAHLKVAKKKLLSDPISLVEPETKQLLSDRISLVKSERLALLKAQTEAVAALKALEATIKSCKNLCFMHMVDDEVDGETVQVAFDGLGVDLNKTAVSISAAFVFNEDFLDGGDLFGL